MRVFVTGAAGFIGQAVVKDFIAAGHQVLGLSRSDSGAEALQALGAEVLRGDLDDLDSLRKGAAETDGTVHLAFGHDFSNFEETCRKDREAIAAMAAVLKGSKRPLIMTTGTLLMPMDHVATEAEDHDASSAFAVARGQSEILAKQLAADGVHMSVMRLAPTNHGAGDKGFITMLTATAKAKGVSAYVGDGQNHWPAVHRLDTARAYRLAFEKAAPHAQYHIVAEEGVKFKDIATMIGQQLGVPTASKTWAEAPEHFGFLGNLVGLNNRVSNEQTRKALGWTPQQCTLLADIEQGTYTQ